MTLLHSQLESLVDQYGIKTVLATLGNVCREHETYCERQRGDRETAGVWMEVGTDLENLGHTTPDVRGW